MLAWALYVALRRKGVEPGTTFVGDDWEDIVHRGYDIEHLQTVRSRTKVGRSHRLWAVEEGGGRGNKRRVTILDAGDPPFS